MKLKNQEKHSFGGFSLGTRHVILSCLLILPAMASLIFFKYIPMILGCFISFFKLDIVNLPGNFVGIENYIRVFKDAKFYSSIGHNLIILIYSMVMNFWVPILFAILINEVRKGKTVFRLAYFIPGCAPAIAMTVLWKYFWQPDYGLANFLISKLGFARQLWLNDSNLVYFCMHFPGLIICGGMNLVIYLAALQNIPQELYEASVLDGANVWNRLKNVTLPQISDTIFLMFTLSLIGVMNTMDNVLVLTGGGPAGHTETVLLYAYKQATNNMDYSYAITMITVVFFITMLLNIISNKLKHKGE